MKKKLGKCSKFIKIFNENVKKRKMFDKSVEWGKLCLEFSFLCREEYWFVSKIVLRNP